MRVIVGSCWNAENNLAFVLDCYNNYRRFCLFLAAKDERMIIFFQGNSLSRAV